MANKSASKASKASKVVKASTNGKAAPRGFTPTECPITLAEFMVGAPAEVTVALDSSDDAVTGRRREFSTGSFGYLLNGKFTIMVNGEPVKFHLNGNLIAVGSKVAPRS